MLSVRMYCAGMLVLALTSQSQQAFAQEDFSEQAKAFRKGNEAVTPLSDSMILAEAEEFQGGGPKGWQARPFGTNYFAATFANAFLSRKAYLGAPEQCEKSVAALEVEVPRAGKYLALIRYECCYRFETQFRLEIEQNGKKVLDRVYGARDNLKIWAFRQKLKKEVAWDWGAGENMVWEGHDAYVTLAAGRARLTLIADKQPEPAAKRNVDCILLTSDEAEVQKRIEKENYLPLDGLLTQQGDVFVKVHSADDTAVSVTFPNGTEHSPYWIHMRTWKPKTVKVEAGKVSDWVEVGSLLDTLADGQWNITIAGKCHLEFGLKSAGGKIESIRQLSNLSGSIALAYDGDTRYSRRVRLADDILYDLVAYLKKQAVHGRPLKRTLFYGYTFNAKPTDAKYTAALNEFVKLMGATALGKDGVENQTPEGLPRGYIDVRSVPTAKLEDYCKKIANPKNIAVVSLGDEIGLASPPAKDHANFRAWLKAKTIKPGDLDPAAGDDYEKISYSAGAETAKTRPGLFYYSKIYAYRYGIKNLKDRTDILRKHLPNAGVGANFSPHHKHMYLGDTHHWISVFREDGMTMPWGEDYIFQVPVGTHQMNSIMVDMYRAAIKNKPGAKIHYYVMAHAPNNTPNSWRRQFYGDIAHGVKVFNLFEFRPAQHAYTENHVNSPAMYQEVRKGIHELGGFEDIVQDGQVHAAETAIWCSETADVWDNHKSPRDAAKRCWYSTLRLHGVPLDFVVDGDELKSYRTIFLLDSHVSRTGSKALAEWVAGGGELIATGGAGMFDELNQPNKLLRELLGVDQKELQEATDLVIRFEKQDLPWAKPMGKVGDLPVYGLRSRIATGKDVKIIDKFDDGSPALTTRQGGKGQASYMAFLPGLTVFADAFPRRPMDRGATDEHMTHFLPTKLHTAPFAGILDRLQKRAPVKCSQSLVESTVVQAKQGVITPLINWRPEPVQKLRVEVSLAVPTAKIALVSGRPVQMTRNGAITTFTLDLDVADALILR